MGWHVVKVLAGVTGVLAVVLTGCAATPESTSEDAESPADTATSTATSEVLSSTVNRPRR